MRIALGIEYDGRPYAGWERQRDQPTVQASLEAALSRIADHPVETTCAGRTDAGVHANSQVVHFDTPASRPAHAWVLGTNTELDDTVAVQWASAVDAAFHARYAARCRHYRYLILNRAARPGLLQGRVGWVRPPLEVAAMQIAAEHLLGEHDFTSFRAAGCQARNPSRCVSHIRVQRHGDFVILDISANAFLQHMVRNICGTLVAVGTGKQSPEWVAELLALRDRTRAGVTMPSAGLYLTGVDYPERYRLPRVSSLPVLW